jgi:hypothetical protein
MQLLNALDVPFEKPRTGHREAGIFFRRLLQGRSCARDNYELSIARTEGFRSPRHHHNFDQIRVGLSGEFGDGRKLSVGPGQIAYYPEGAYYEIDCGESEILLLQFGGANGDGYPSLTDLYAAYEEMSKVGTFRDGVFFRTEREDLPPGVKKNMDGYEALWQHIFGRPVVYPRPRYREPIFMEPERYGWVADPAEPGVRRKSIGVFTERTISVAQIEVSPGATLLERAGAAVRFLYVHAGRARSAAGAWLPWSVAKLERYEALEVTAEEALFLTVISLPEFSDAELP